MEKKNNKLVDKEKDLKNVVPDTDVGPDVTDFSPVAHGEPSRSSSNREQMRLINKIDFYKWKINLLTELVDVEREQLEKKRDRRTDTLKEKQRRRILSAKLKASDEDAVVGELYAKKNSGVRQKAESEFQRIQTKSAQSGRTAQP